MAKEQMKMGESFGAQVVRATSAKARTRHLIIGYVVIGLALSGIGYSIFYLYEVLR